MGELGGTYAMRTELDLSIRLYIIINYNISTTYPKPDCDTYECFILFSIIYKSRHACTAT